MLTNPKGNLDEIMAELQQEYLAVKAPAHLQALLSEQAAANAPSKRRVSPNKILGWGLSLALLTSIVAVISWSMHRNHPSENHQAKDVDHALPSSDQNVVVPVTRSSDVKSKLTAAHHAHHRLPRDDSGNTLQASSMNEFIALPTSEGLPPASAISLVRMQIDQSALQQYGLEVPVEASPKTLLADFAVGDDGLPRAIRIIR
jgi:hypothetical protein